MNHKRVLGQNIHQLGIRIQSNVSSDLGLQERNEIAH